MQVKVELTNWKNIYVSVLLESLFWFFGASVWIVEIKDVLLVLLLLPVAWLLVWKENNRTTSATAKILNELIIIITTQLLHIDKYAEDASASARRKTTDVRQSFPKARFLRMAQRLYEEKKITEALVAPRLLDALEPTFEIPGPRRREKSRRFGNRHLHKAGASRRFSGTVDGCRASCVKSKQLFCQELCSTTLFVCMCLKLESFKNTLIYTGLEKEKKKCRVCVFFLSFFFFFFKKSWKAGIYI